MSEKKLVIDQMKLTFEGIFDLNGLYRTIDSWFYEKNYDKFEKKNFEQIMPTGKDVEIEILPWKKTTDYFKNIIRMRMKFVEVKDVEIEQKGVKMRLNQGRVMIIFDGYLESDYDQRWESSSFWMAVRDWWMKYIMRREIESIYHDEIYYRTFKLQKIIKGYLDMEAKGNEYEGYLGDNV